MTYPLVYYCKSLSFPNTMQLLRKIFSSSSRQVFTIVFCVTLSFSVTSNASHNRYATPTSTGFLGLNTVPSARMDKTGTVRLGIATLDPYIHGHIGIQIAAPLYINVRQSAETSSLKKDAKHLYPGIDFKLRLQEESAYAPEIALGIQSALGHQRMSGEFIALSKRYNNFDFTFGLGWGRYGTAKHFTNPLKNISNHFSKNRNFNSVSPNTPANWFSGNSIGLFGGVEYFLPYDGLSLKLDYGSDRYTAEQQSFDYDAPAPWGAGLSYTYNKWISAGIGMQGTDKVMGRLSIQSTPASWPFTEKKYDAPIPLYKTRPTNSNIEKMRQSANNSGIELTNIIIEKHKVSAILNIPAHTNAPQHIGRAIRHIATHSGAEIEVISILPKYENLLGKTVEILRSDVEKALDNNQGSPEEIWKNLHFTTTDTDNLTHSPFISKMGIKTKRTLFNIKIENQISLSEEDNGTLYRSSALIKAKRMTFLGLTSGSTLRINLHDNLDNIENLRPPSTSPTRSDVNSFTNQRLSLDNAYVSYTHSITPSTHIALTAGYLEEFYSGIGGEVLYRPYNSRFALGAELWRVQRRQPFTTLNLGHSGYATTTGHINGWYDIPEQDITLNAKAGRFLAGDNGLSIGLTKRFRNGATLDSEITITDAADPDLFGGTTHAYHRLGLTLPLGSIPYIPEGSTINTIIAPFGRDTGQSLDKPLNLYDMTENFTLDHMATYWDKILD